MAGSQHSWQAAIKSRGAKCNLIPDAGVKPIDYGTLEHVVISKSNEACGKDL